MKLEHYSPAKINSEIGAIVGRHLDMSKYRVFFFGSRVTGLSSERSDIDIGIDGDAPVPARAMQEIREAIEHLPTLYKIDIVDFSQVPPGFRSLALRQTQPVQLATAV